MTKILEEVIKKKWKDKYPICKLHKLADEEDNEKFVVIGTLFKDQKLKPSVLKWLSEDNHLAPQPIYNHFTDQSDVLCVEDEIQRYQLIGSLTGERLVTGITCAMLVVDMGNGKLTVHDYCFAGYRNQIERPIFNEDFFIMILSGLDLVHIENTMLSLQILTNFIRGTLGDLNNIKVSNVVRLIVAGNCTRNEAEKVKPSLSLTSKISVSEDSIEAVKALDALLNHWCEVIDVDVMPGLNDPTNQVIPQQPMHRCMFPNSGLYKSLHLVSNPFECEVGGLKLMGTSGQPVADISKYCELTDPLDVLEHCLEWNHIAPTAPDTLGCFPYYDTDPFIIDECPHILFAGNQENFASKICKGTC